jgi:DNA polymerase-1
MARKATLERRADERHAFYDEAAANHEYVIEPRRVQEILDILGDNVCALDFETTGLDARERDVWVRLTCLYHPKIGAVLIDHMFAGSFKEWAPKMCGPMWAVYNAKFEVSFFDEAVYGKVDIIDVDFLYKARNGGTASSLARLAKTTLGLELDKSEQVSDWSEPKLTQSQLNYAALDAVVTYKLYETYVNRNTKAQNDAAFIFQDAVRATVECERTGFGLDVDAHQKNIEMWTRKQEIAMRRVRRITPRGLIDNLGSDIQVSNFLKTQLGKETLSAWPKTEKTEQLSLSRPIIGPIAAKSPYPFSRWLNALILFRYYRKYLSTYGETVINKYYMGDGVHFRLNIAQAATGRYSSSSINIQNIPRNPKVRRAFLPPNGFDGLAVADYSGIEVRVLAELSQDARLLQDAIYGDVHAGSASAIYRIDEDEFHKIYHDSGHRLNAQYKEHRSRAKGFTFQNVYGAGAHALSIVLKSSVAAAEDALRKWAERYPKAYNYRHIMFDRMTQSGFISVTDGRTVFVYKQDRTLPVASNYGIQGAAASAMYRAMYHVHRLRDEESNYNLIRLVATVHDELILAYKDGHHEHAKSILERGMIQGWLDIFPGTDTHKLVEAGHGPNWGDAKK